MPFRELFKVIEVTEMRPVSALPPVLGLLMGVPGALGCALGKLAADFISGFTPLLCLTGFVPQLIYGIIPILMWNIFKRSDTATILRLHNVKNIMRYIVIVVTDSAAMAVMLGLMTQFFDISPFLSTSTLMMFLNNLVFCMVLGIPIIIFTTMKKLRDRHEGISLTERFVLVFLLLGAISASLIGIFAYAEVSRYITDPLTMWNRIYLYITIDLLIIYFITVLFLWYSERNITIPIETIARIASNYTDGDEEKRDSASVVAECEPFCANRNETGTLAKAFRTMVTDLDAYIENLTAVTAEKERISAELGVATKIQADMLPNFFPPFPDRKEFDLYASMIPAREVGGDFYDFFLIDGDHLGIVIADVSGKSIPAALFMVIAKTLINNRARENEAPQDVFMNVNNLLCEGNETSMFVTAWLGILELSTGSLTYVNAGHNPPLLKRSGGSFEYLKTPKGFVLAGIENFKYEQLELKLGRYDTLFLYTDGVTEANNPSDELYGEHRLQNILNANSDLPPAKLLPRVKEDIDMFAQGAAQFDDITMLAIRINI
jgi:serine phosphatase RsbU (regulator of sigma subunit)/uncharacterized membrane protein YuzA (DUF378 family)